MFRPFRALPLLALLGCAGAAPAQEPPGGYPVTKTDAEWQALLTPEEYKVLRQGGTERAFTGRYWDAKEDGVYTCAGCGHALFRSDDKFDSGTGWPSYTRPASDAAVATKDDRKFGMLRTEVLCARCGGHLGHVFRDGPAPTGLRYCMNGNAMRFEPASTP